MLIGSAVGLPQGGLIQERLLIGGELRVVLQRGRAGGQEVNADQRLGVAGSQARRDSRPRSPPWAP